MKFPYACYEVDPMPTTGGSTHLFRPEIPFRLIGASDDAFLIGLLDTGADETLIGRSIADAIGATVDESQTWPNQGFAGEILQVRLAYVEIEVGDDSESHRWPAAIGVVDYPDPALEQVAILGHAGFLHFFDSEFRGADRQVILRANATMPG